ncbi:unnamed protein product [Protopolystoma xenopodis]|uniref:Uncharacterized protein n=1 Tax=Protopolystoma xenopodis TaxID=117903 RepID=A0A448WUU7_9PLAT|nr:unnamed protein product [Protopolystoma xenopodis]
MGSYRLLLRLGWATNGFYVPPGLPPCPPGSTPKQVPRAVTSEAMPRCLQVSVAGRPVPLPDAIFHGGQAQKLGKRLLYPIDVTNQVSFQF